MTSGGERLSVNSAFTNTWGVDWAWGASLIVLTVIVHAYGLALIDQRVSSATDGKRQIPSLTIGLTALSVIVLHALEGFIWAGAYCLLGAIPNFHSAVLYSLNAVTSYGHESLALASRWEMMGALEALNGWILFGLTTAMLFSVFQKIWPPADRKSA